MKKLLTFVATSAILLGLAGCSSTPAANTETNAESPAVTETTEVTVETTEEVIEEEYVYVPYTPTGDLTLLDDFEDGLFWTFVGDSWNDGDCSTGADLTEEWGSSGPNSLKCSFRSVGSGKWEKGGYVCEGASLIEQDWSGAKMILFDVNNPNDFDIEVMFVSQAGENWDAWNQTGSFKCPAKSVTPVYFNISGHRNLEIVNRAIIYIAGNDAPTDGYFMVDNVQLEF